MKRERRAETLVSILNAIEVMKYTIVQCVVPAIALNVLNAECKYQILDTFKTALILSERELGFAHYAERR